MAWCSNTKWTDGGDYIVGGGEYEVTCQKHAVRADWCTACVENSENDSETSSVMAGFIFLGLALLAVGIFIGRSL